MSKIIKFTLGSLVLSLGFNGCGEYTWKKKTYTMEQHLDKLDMQSEEKANWILKEVNKNLNEE